MKLILYTIITLTGLVLVLGSYRLGTIEGSENSATELVNKLRQNCNEGTHYTTLDNKWDLRCIRSQERAISLETLQKDIKNGGLTQ